MSLSPAHNHRADGFWQLGFITGQVQCHCHQHIITTTTMIMIIATLVRKSLSGPINIWVMLWMNSSQVFFRWLSTSFFESTYVSMTAGVPCHRRYTQNIVTYQPCQQPRTQHGLIAQQTNKPVIYWHWTAKQVWIEHEDAQEVGLMILNNEIINKWKYLTHCRTKRIV